MVGYTPKTEKTAKTELTKTDKELPSSALNALKLAGGKEVTFKNGQTWKWSNNKATRVK